MSSQYFSDLADVFLNSETSRESLSQPGWWTPCSMGASLRRVAGVAGHGNVCIYAKVMSELRTAMRLRNDLL